MPEEPRLRLLLIFPGPVQDGVLLGDEVSNLVVVDEVLFVLARGFPLGRFPSREQGFPCRQTRVPPSHRNPVGVCHRGRSDGGSAPTCGVEGFERRWGRGYFSSNERIHRPSGPPSCLLMQ